MMIRQLFLLVVLSLLLLSGCTGEAPTPRQLHVGVLMFGDSRQGQVDGFIAGLKELGYNDGQNIRYTIHNAKNDRKRLPFFVNELDETGVDLIAAAGGLETDALQKAFTGRDDVPPVVVLYINSILARGTVHSMERAGWGVTGVDNLNAELSGKRLALLHDLLPDAKRVLMLYYPKIAPSRIGKEIAERTAPSLGITLDARAVTSRGEIKTVMESLKAGEVDAMLTVPTAPIDNALKEIILPVTNRLAIPIYTHSLKLASHGGVASYGARFYDMGFQASRLADKIFNGAAISSMPFETPQQFIYAVNQRVTGEMGITLSPLVKNQINEFIN